MKKLVLIDGNALVHRAFHALPPLTAPDGTVTNAVFGFSSILMRTIKDVKPDYIAAAFDLAGPTFRHEQYDEYKAKRGKAVQELYDQIPLTKDVLHAFGIPVYEKQGFEADDVIGTIAKHTDTEKIKVIIMTGDLDTLQLVENSRIVVLTPKKGLGETTIYDQKAVKDRYNLKPDQLNDFKGLKGDSSDNIPGVPGIGEKTASTLIGEFKTLEKLYEALEKDTKKIQELVKPKTKEKLLEHKDQAFFSKHLSTIVLDVDVQFRLEASLWREHVDLNKIEESFKKFGFSSLVRRLDEIDLGKQTSLLGNDNEQTRQNVEKSAHELTPQLLPELTQQATKSKYLAVATNDQTLYLSVDSKKVFHVSPDSAAWNKKVFHELITNPKIKIIGHDLKPFLKLLTLKHGSNRGHVGQIGDIYGTSQWIDTRIMGYMLNIGNGRKYDFDHIFQNEFNESVSDDPVSIVTNIKKLADHFEKQLAKSPVAKPLADIELPLIPVLASMESYGIKVNIDAIKDLKKKASRTLTGLEKKIYTQAGTEFNISSPKQLGEILYDKLGITGKVKKTSGGARSTAADQLEKIRDAHPIIPLIFEYRELSKLKSTYIEPFLDWVDPDTSRVHTTYDQTGSATGRLASRDPNLQNIPVRTELGQEFRKVFVPERGYRLVACDYSQIELRIAAHLAGDKIMIRAFKNNEDIHTRTAAQVFGVTPDLVSKDQRRTAKVLNFGIMYGMGVMGFGRAAGVGRNEARAFMDTYFAEFSDMAQFLEKTKLKAHKQGYVDTLFGHRRYLPDLKSTMPQLLAAAERMAINMPMQGTSADIMKLAMIHVHEHIAKYGDDVRMLLQIHDELVFEIKKDLVKKVSNEIKEIMEDVYKLDVPLVVDVKSGSNWQEMK